jgi:hypothetical protein
MSRTQRAYEKALSPKYKILQGQKQSTTGGILYRDQRSPREAEVMYRHLSGYGFGGNVYIDDVVDVAEPCRGISSMIGSKYFVNLPYFNANG